MDYSTVLKNNCYNFGNYCFLFYFWYFVNYIQVREFIFEKRYVSSSWENHVQCLRFTLVISFTHWTYIRRAEDIQNFFETFYVRSIDTTSCFQKEISVKFCFVSDFALLLNFCFWKFYKLILYFYLILSCFTLTSSRKTIP